jgi:hypothetical protein
MLRGNDLIQRGAELAEPLDLCVVRHLLCADDGLDHTGKRRIKNVAVSRIAQELKIVHDFLSFRFV